MNRKEFFKKSGCGMLCFSTAPLFTKDLTGNGQEQSQKPRHFKIEIEIFETRKDTWCHKKGDRFAYPSEMGKICPWLLSSMHDFIILLENNVTLGWKFEGTPYEKIINKDGITTEYVRCPDPTGNVVAKIIRTEIV